jgi:plastocyanin
VRRNCLWIGILAALVVAATPARAANQTVTATSSNDFVPAAVTVLQGESVTWNNGGGFHNVLFDDNSFDMPPDPDPSSWTVARSFNTPGTFRYYCEAHGGPNGSGMSGTVTVQAPGTTPGPGPGPAQPQPVAADRTAPALKLGGRGIQKVLRQRSVAVVVKTDEASTVVARGTISVPGASRIIRLKKASRRVAPGAKAKLVLRLSRPKLRSLRRAFEKRPRLTARVTVTGSDQAGNRRSAKRKVKLKA